MSEFALDKTEATRRFYEWVWPLMPAALRVAKALCHRSQDAEDLVQETMLKAFRGLDGFAAHGDIATNTKAWLLTILRHTWVDRVRSFQGKDTKTVDLPEAYADPSAIDPALVIGSSWETPEDLLNGFSDPQIIDALHALPEEIRWTLLLVNVSGMDHDDAAAVLGVPPGTIKSRAFRGRAMLRDALLPLARERGPVQE